MGNDLTIKNTQQLSAYFVTELNNSMTLPEGTDEQRLVLNFISLLQDKPELMNFEKPVLATALVRMAQDNLDALNNEVYLYKGYNGKLTYTPSYKGLRKMALQKSVKPIKDITTKLIYEGDTLDEEYTNGESHLHYKSDFMKRGKWIGVFCTVLFKDGSEIHEIMNMDDINAVKAKSKNSGAWKDFPGEMAKKAVIRRICKQITMGFSDKEQADTFTGADEFISDPKEQAEKDIKEHANKQTFDDNEVVEVELTEADRVIEGEQQSMFDTEE